MNPHAASRSQKKRNRKAKRTTAVQEPETAAPEVPAQLAEPVGLLSGKSLDDIIKDTKQREKSLSRSPASKDIESFEARRQRLGMVEIPPVVQRTLLQAHYLAREEDLDRIAQQLQHDRKVLAWAKRTAHPEELYPSDDDSVAGVPSVSPAAQELDDARIAAQLQHTFDQESSQLKNSQVKTDRAFAATVQEGHSKPATYASVAEARAASGHVPSRVKATKPSARASVRPATAAAATQPALDADWPAAIPDDDQGPAPKEVPEELAGTEASKAFRPSCTAHW